MGPEIVNEHSLGLVEVSMLGNTRMEKLGTEHNMKKRKHYQKGCKGKTVLVVIP